MTERMRLWGALNWPNRISILRLALLAPYVILLMNQQQWHWARYAALALVAVMAASDALDGQLARRLNARSRLGAILDPLADKALIILSVLLLAYPPTAVAGHVIRNWVVVVVVGKDLWVIIGFVVVYLVTDRLRVYPTITGKAATVGQLAMVIAVLVAPDLNAVSGGWRVGDAIARGMQWLVAAVSVLAAVSYTRLGLRFMVQEEKPLDNHAGGKEKTDASD